MRQQARRATRRPCRRRIRDTSTCAPTGPGPVYNDVCRVAPTGRVKAVILRVAPREARRLHIERHLMRDEYASRP